MPPEETPEDKGSQRLSLTKTEQDRQNQILMRAMKPGAHIGLSHTAGELRIFDAVSGVTLCGDQQVEDTLRKLCELLRVQTAFKQSLGECAPPTKMGRKVARG